MKYLLQETMGHFAKSKLKTMHLRALKIIMSGVKLQDGITVQRKLNLYLKAVV